MPVKLKYGSNKTSTQRNLIERLHLENRFVRFALIAVLGCLVIAATFFGYFYFKYERIVDDRLAKGPMFASVSQIYAAPREVRNGQKLSASTIAADLRQAGYNNNPQLGTYQLNGDSIFIKPGPQRPEALRFHHRCRSSPGRIQQQSAARHLSAERRQHLYQARSAELPHHRRRHHHHQQRRRPAHHSRKWRSAQRLRARAAAHHRIIGRE